MKCESNRFIYAIHHYATGSDGYAIRGHGLAKALQEEVNKIMGNSCTHEFKFKYTLKIDIDDIRYLHLYDDKQDTYQEFMKIFKPDAVLAASNWRHAKPIQQAAQQLNLPFWYEARGFWEFSNVHGIPPLHPHLHFRERWLAKLPLPMLLTTCSHSTVTWPMNG